MKKISFYYFIQIIFLFILGISISSCTDSNVYVDKACAAISEKYPDSDPERIVKGVRGLAEYYLSHKKSLDDDFLRFCTDNYIADENMGQNLGRIEDRLMVLDNSVYEVSHYFNEQRNYTDSPQLLCDRAMDELHLNVDYGEFFNRFMMLNFPNYTFKEKIDAQFVWDREKWAMANLGSRYSRNLSFEENPYTRKHSDFSDYMANYFIDMSRLLNDEGTLYFPDGTMLHSHRGLRDDIKGIYAEKDGCSRQRLEYMIIEHILQGSIPERFRKDSSVYWNPETNQLYEKSGTRFVEIADAIPEGIARYAGIRDAFHFRSFDDAFFEGEDSNYIDRCMHASMTNLQTVEMMLKDFLSSNVLADLSALVQKQVGRNLEPFDLWYSGFQEQAFYSTSFLDSLTRKLFPTPKAFNDSISYILENLDFPVEEAEYIGNHIQVRPVVSGGYSNQPADRDGFALLTTMFDEKGMDYKSYRVAMHELGHCVCGIYSTRDMDHFALAGVPGAGPTEGVAELFAYLNVKGLKLDAVKEKDRTPLLTLAAAWYLYEMAGQALTEIEVWKWYYANQDASAEEFKTAVLSISANVWNRYFSGNFNGFTDSHILSIYNHFTTGDLYLHNYFASNIIMLQLSAACGSDLSNNLQRICLEGATSLDRWMKNGTGDVINIQKLLMQIEDAVRHFN